MIGWVSDKSDPWKELISTLIDLVFKPEVETKLVFENLKELIELK